MLPVRGRATVNHTMKTSVYAGKAGKAIMICRQAVNLPTTNKINILAGGLMPAIYGAMMMTTCRVSVATPRVAKTSQLPTLKMYAAVHYLSRRVTAM